MVKGKLYRLTLSSSFGDRDIQGVISVVFTRWSTIPDVDSVCGPCATDVTFLMDEYFGAQESDVSSVEFERAVHCCFC